jgi:hypothetical protein
MIGRRQYCFQPIWSDHLGKLVWSWIPAIAKDGGRERPEQLSQSMANRTESGDQNGLITY